MFSLGKTEMLLGMHRNTAVENFVSENLDASVVLKEGSWTQCLNSSEMLFWTPRVVVYSLGLQT